MIGYTTVGTNNFVEAATFYDKLLAMLGAKRVMDFGSAFVLWGRDLKSASFALVTPYDGGTATVGNGTMIALGAPDRETVDKVHAAAIKLGGSCEGQPGLRGDEKMGFYAGYFRDLDGNKLNVFNMKPQK